jgi:hypothetical protein
MIIIKLNTRKCVSVLSEHRSFSCWCHPCGNKTWAVFPKITQPIFLIFLQSVNLSPITVVALSRAWFWQLWCCVRGFESRSGMNVCPRLVLCCPVEDGALRRSDPSSRGSYQMSNWFIISEVTLDWNRSQDLIRKDDDGDGDEKICRN